MLRRLILAAFALTAFLALESCGVSRIAGPAAKNDQAPIVDKRDPSTEPGQPGGDRTDAGVRNTDNTRF